MKRTTAYLTAPKRFELIEEDVPVMHDDEMIVKVISSGLCHSDTPIWNNEGLIDFDRFGNMKRGEMAFPTAFGHEPVGIVVDVGKNIKKFKVGDWVGGPTLLTPGFTTYIVVKEIQMALIPEGTRNIERCLVEPMQCCSNIVRIANPLFYETVAVIGCGIMGLMTIGGLKKSAAGEIIAIDFDDKRLEYAKKLGATITINPKKEDVEQIIFELTKNRGVDVVIEITGSLDGLKTAADIVRNAEFFGPLQGGKLLIPSMYGKNEPWKREVGYKLMIKSVQMHSVHPWYSANLELDRENAVKAYIDGLMPIDDYITHEFKFTEMEKAFKTMVSGDPSYIKGIIKPWEM